MGPFRFSFCVCMIYAIIGVSHLSFDLKEGYHFDMYIPHEEDYFANTLRFIFGGFGFFMCVLMPFCYFFSFP